MEVPSFIHFQNDSLMILRQTLLAVSPQEGCAILLGQQKQSKDQTKGHHLIIQLIWPCCNIWEPGVLNLSESSTKSNFENQSHLSRENRFALDPREQFLAQKWARERNLQILGNAHSHPCSNAIPSLIDQSWTFSSELMVIICGSGELGAWWMEKNKKFSPLHVVDSN